MGRPLQRYAVGAFIVALDKAKATSGQAIFARCLVQWFLSEAWLRHNKAAGRGGLKEKSLWGPPELRHWLFARGCVGIGGIGCFYYAVTKLPLADATVLFFTNPIWTIIIAWAVLGETIGPTEAVSTCCSIAGVALVARPRVLFGTEPGDGTRPARSSSTAADDWGTGPGGHWGKGGAGAGGEGGAGEDAPAGVSGAAIAVALLGAVSAACAFVVVRRIKQVHSMIVVKYFAVFGLMAAPVISLSQGVGPVPPRTTWISLFWCGVVGFLAQCSMTRGLQLENAAPASLIRTLDVFLAFGFQAAFLGEPVQWSSLGGGALNDHALLRPDRPQAD